MLKKLVALFARNEHTSPKLASDAGRIFRMSDAAIMDLAVREPKTIRSMAASLLTQANDK